METQQGTPPSVIDAASDSAEQARWQRDVRDRVLLVREHKAPKAPRWLVRITIAAAIALHLGLLVALRVAMQPPMANEAVPIQVTLLDAPLAEPPLPEVEHEISPLQRSNPPARASSTRTPRAAAPGTSPPAVSVEAISTFRAYNMDGSLNIPKDLAAQLDRVPAESFHSPSVEMSPIMRHQRPLKIRPNHFAQNWLPAPNESLLGTFVREHVVKEKEFITPWGTHVSCGWFVMMGGCSWGPPPVWTPPQTWRPATALDEY